MKFEPVTLKLQVRPNDLDSLGHVNNATVLEYLEAGRWAWLDRHLLRRGQQILPVVSRIEIDYHREILPVEIAVTTELEQPEDKFTCYKVFFNQSVETGQENKLIVAAKARIKVAFIDRVERCLRSLQDFLDENEFVLDNQE